jgi:hypothetical protein
MQMVSKDFAYAQFKPLASNKDWMPEGEYQKFLVDNLAKNLQVVRSAMPFGCSMQITSGVRTQYDFDRLMELGYRPSETSDHYCGNVVKLPSSSKNIQKFGPYYFFSSGAADIVPSGADVEYLFKLGVSLTKKNLCNFGQIILEEDNSAGKKWVHFSNNYDLIFSKDIVKMLARSKFLTTTDGGKTYTPYNL